MIYLIFVIILNLMIGNNAAINIEQIGTQDRIFNGTKPRTGELPFMVLILTNVFMPGNRFMSICSGSLIGVNTILSAAHCYKDKSPANVVVAVGLANTRHYALHRYSHPFSAKFDYSRTLQEAIAQRFHIHPNYDKGYDLAIVKVASPFIITDSVKTIQFTLDKYPLGMPCNLSGYGKDEKGFTPELGYFTTTKVQIDIRRCRFTSENPFFYCLERLERTDPKICKGDSGGPMVCDNKIYAVHVSFRYIANESKVCGARGAIKLVSLAASEEGNGFLTVYSQKLESSSNQLLPRYYVFITVLLFFGCKL